MWLQMWLALIVSSMNGIHQQRASNMQTSKLPTGALSTCWTSHRFSMPDLTMANTLAVFKYILGLQGKGMRKSVVDLPHWLPTLQQVKRSLTELYRLTTAADEHHTPF